MTEQISLNLTLEELEIIDKFVELDDNTRQLFDKIRGAYPKSPLEAKPKTLTDIVYDWWGDAFTFHVDWDKETCVEDLIDQVEQWLPKQTDVCEEYSYETGRNHVIDTIKRNLR